MREMDAPYVYEYAVPITFPGSQAEAFRALTNEDALKIWFAEHAEIDAKEGGAYRFWGRYTLGTVKRADATQKITDYGPVTTLSFSRRLMGRDSVVTWTLAPDGDTGSKVTIRHEFASLPDGVRVQEMIDDLWRLHSGNLCFYLKGERDIYRPDFDDPNPKVTQTIVINAPPEKFSQLW